MVPKDLASLRAVLLATIRLFCEHHAESRSAFDYECHQLDLAKRECCVKAERRRRDCAWFFVCLNELRLKDDRMTLLCIIKVGSSTVSRFRVISGLCFLHPL